MRQLSVAVVGTNTGCKLHVRPLRAAGFHVAALIGQDAERTRQRAEEWDIPKVCTFEEALDSDVDAVVIATPPASHHEQVMRALAAKKHVLCEKPFALDPGHAREMRDAAREAGLANLLVHPQRWLACYVAVRRMIDSGVIGDVLQARFTFDHPLLAHGRHTVPEWWRWRAQGGGWTRNYASHGIDGARFLLGEFQSLVATTNADTDADFTSDDTYAVTFRGERASGVMLGSCRSTIVTNDSRVIGTKGTLVFNWRDLAVHGAGEARSEASGPAVIAGAIDDANDPDGLVRATIAADASSEPSPGFGFNEQVALSRAFHARIVDPGWRHPSMADFDDGLRHVEIIAAVDRSAFEGRWVDVQPSL